MAKKSIKKIVKQYAQTLTEHGINFKHIYLFGSHAKNQEHKWSDIDVLVVAERFGKDYFDYKKNLWRLIRQVDSRIEPHACTAKDFREDATMAAYEAKKTGEKVV